MDRLIAFVNTFFSYLLVMAVIVVVAGVATFIGIKIRKNKNRTLGEQQSSEETA